MERRLIFLSIIAALSLSGCTRARKESTPEMEQAISALRGAYAAFIGHLYTNPRVRPVCDEGRSFLRHTDQRYDIIQIHSNHTTSSVAQGAGGADPGFRRGAR